MDQIRAVFLDFDGTLVDSEPLHFDCWLRAVEPYGSRISWEDYGRRLVGISDREAGRILLSEAGHKPDDRLLDAACRAKKLIYRERFCRELSILDELLVFVRNLRSSLLFGVVSSSLTLEVEPLLVQTGLRSSLDVLICGDHVRNRKPDPEPYVLALQRLNQNGLKLVEPAQCLAFEDSDVGVAAAQGAGMRVHRVASPENLLEALKAHFG